MAETVSIGAKDHQGYMRYAVSLAKQAPPRPTNFCVGAVLVDELTNNTLATGYTMELPGNTHAEQCCIMKYEEAASNNETSENLVLYTTMEPCNKRASGNAPCTETILNARMDGKCGIKTVYVGVQEPKKFVGQNTGKAKLEAAGVAYVHVSGLEDEILAVATAGHQQE